MSLLLKILRRQENLSSQRKTRHIHQEALRKNESPDLYLVKQKLRNHPDTRYSSMSEEELNTEATLLTDPDTLKAFFRDLTHQPIHSILEEVGHEQQPQGLTQSALSVEQSHVERAGRLTLKLHLSHIDGTPTLLTRMGAALLKIPYGVLHATLEIGDTTNPNTSYMLEFNNSHLIQPRRKGRREATALEATIPLGGVRFRQLEAWPRPPTSAQVRLREQRSSIKTGVGVVDSYYSPQGLPLRPRSKCIRSRYGKKPRSHSDPTTSRGELDTSKETSSSKPQPVTRTRSGDAPPVGVGAEMASTWSDGVGGYLDSDPTLHMDTLEEERDRSELPDAETTPHATETTSQDIQGRRGACKDEEETGRGMQMAENCSTDPVTVSKPLKSPSKLEKTTRGPEAAAECSTDPTTTQIPASLPQTRKLEQTVRGLEAAVECSTNPISLRHTRATRQVNPLLRGTTAAPTTNSSSSSEDLTHLIQLSLSKIILVEKLVGIIVRYNTRHYYNSITRNCQTFVVDVLQSFGVWENFRLGQTLDVYLKNLSKGKKEVYKSHKSVNDRVLYLVRSGEMEETTYDEMRYLRSLYAVFHLEEASVLEKGGQGGAMAVCGEADCMLAVLEEHLSRKRPENATSLLPPEYYL